MSLAGLGVSLHTSLNSTFTLRFRSAQRGEPLEQLCRARVCAIVSPASGEKVAVVPGNGWPVEGAPALMELKRPARPWDFGFCAVAGLWQPLHSRVSPGRSCSQLVWMGEMRRPFASRMLNWNAMFAGTLIFTEPSGSTGA